MAAKKNILFAPAEAETASSAASLRNDGQKGSYWHDSAGKFDNCSGQDAARDSAEYIAVLASQLQRIASSNGHEFLAYLIDMVVVEAWRIAGPDGDHPNRHGQPHRVLD